MALSFSTFIACIFFLIASMAELSNLWWRTACQSWTCFGERETCEAGELRKLGRRLGGWGGWGREGASVPVTYCAAAVRARGGGGVDMDHILRHHPFQLFNLLFNWFSLSTMHYSTMGLEKFKSKWEFCAHFSSTNFHCFFIKVMQNCEVYYRFLIIYVKYLRRYLQKNMKGLMRHLESGWSNFAVPNPLHICTAELAKRMHQIWVVTPPLKKGDRGQMMTRRKLCCRHLPLSSFPHMTPCPSGSYYPLNRYYMSFFCGCLIPSDAYKYSTSNLKQFTHPICPPTAFYILCSIYI